MPCSARRATFLCDCLQPVELTFTRGSVAYDSWGRPYPVNEPRFEHKIYEGGVSRTVNGILIEEAHTNILTAGASQSLDAPYTTGTLNGTYTFSCATGSITLSGGATGTVTPSTPITATISSATVTLTPTGTPTLNQITNTAYPLSWTLGGTSQSAEVLTAPPTVFNIDTAGYSNLLPSAQASSLSSGSPYTTPTLMAGRTYTFSCGTGSYVLSGGATGTVTPSNPITITPGAVTITLTGDSTNNQYSATSTVKPWIGGGAVVNTGTGTIEMEVFNTHITGSAEYAHYLAIATSTPSPAYNHNRILLRQLNGNWSYHLRNNLQAVTEVIKSNTAPLKKFAKISMMFGDTLKGFVNGSFTSNAPPNLTPPSEYGEKLYIGSWCTGLFQCNTIIRNITISWIKRSDSEIAARAAGGEGVPFGTDLQVSLVAPLMHDLKAYGVRA